MLWRICENGWRRDSWEDFATYKNAPRIPDWKRGVSNISELVSMEICSLFSAALFVLFAASARAGIVASRNFLAFGWFMGALFAASQIENKFLAL